MLLTMISLLAAAPMSDLDAARSLRADPLAMASADRNGDGRIDEEELDRFKASLEDAPVASIRSRIGSRDHDGDGALTPAELYEGVPSPGR